MKILIAPLNWGLGHATRCVPVIQKLIAEGHEVVIVADGYPIAFLRQEFPSLRFLEFPSYSIYYSTGKSQIGAMIFNLPNIISGIIREHLWLRNLLRAECFDQVISDNRFGMWNHRVYSVYITHQIMVKMPDSLNFFEPFVYWLHKMVIKQYDECRIPDHAENGGLSGDLAHKYPLPDNAEFIGPLSRFQGQESTQPETKYEIVAVISGVEPQRSIFENNLILKYKNRPEKVLIVQGQPIQAEKISKQIGSITLVSHLPDDEMVAVLIGANKIICRSGYSSIMDLYALNCLNKTELIPTPGQTEQEYLFTVHSSQ